MKNISIFKKILIVFTAVGFITMFTDSLIIGNIFKKTIIKNADKQFKNDLKRKKHEIEKYFKQTEKKIEIIGNFFAVQNLFNILKNYQTETVIDKNNDFPVKTAKYKELTAKYFDYFSNFIKENDYYDIFFICAEHGHVMFTVAHEDDFGANLSTGKYKNTHLAELWRNVVSQKQTIITDYKSYAPSKGAQAIFIGTPIYSGNKFTGVLVVQISTEKNNEIIIDPDKLYKTSETYIVGKSEDGKYRLKSDRIIKQGKIGNENIDKIIIKCINKNETGKIIKIGSTGKEEYEYYTPLKIKGLQWGLFTTVSVDEILEPISNEKKIMLLVSVITTLLIIISAYLLSKSISEPINEVVDAMKKMSEKEMNFKIIDNRKDEIGKLYKSINEINTNFGEILTNINITTNTVSGASEQLSSSSQNISEQTNLQSFAIEDIANSMKQITQTISTNTSKAEITSKNTTKSAKELELSNKGFMKTIKFVRDINEKTSFISDIAFQINILALNASIQAAKADASGKGFSVIAQEMSNLAEKSKKAAAEINNLSQNGKIISQQSALKQIEIIPEIIRSANLVNQITRASKKQKTEIETINNSIQQLTEISNNNSAAAEEMSASAEELASQSEQLKKLISVFKIDNLHEKNEL